MNLLLFSLILTFRATQICALWPIPHSLHTSTSFVKLDPSFDVRLEGIDHPPDDLQDAISRTKYHLQNDKFERLVVGRGAIDHNNLENAPCLSTLELSLDYGNGGVQSIMHEAIKPLGSRIEGYTLSIPAAGGSARISANSTLGLFRGLTTFEQLFYFDGNCTIYTYQAPVQIYDSPTYVGHISIPNHNTGLNSTALQRIYAGHLSQLVSFSSTGVIFTDHNLQFPCQRYQEDSRRHEHGEGR